MKKKNRRLLNTAMVVALTTIFSYGLYKTANIEKASAETVNYELNVSYGETTNTTYQTFDQQNGLIYWNEKNNFQNNNSALLVKGSFYGNAEDSGESDNTSTSRVIACQPSTPMSYGNQTWQKATRCMYYIAITGYNINNDTEFNARINCSFVGLTNQSVGGYFYKETYRSTDQWSNYYNRTDYGNQHCIWEWQTQIESPYNAYNYTKQIEQLTIPSNAYTQDYTFDQTFTVSANKTTYYIIVMTVIMTGASSIVTYNNPYVYFATGRALTVTGTNIIPTGNYEVVDIGGLMFQILTMPFTWYSMAFNITLFEGTPYAVNISQLLLALIAVLVFVFILKIIIGMAKGG